MNKMNKKGFTLIEMLVVIAIIAVLVSIIIPTVSSSTDRAKAAADAANLRSAKAVIATMILEGKVDNSTAAATVTAAACGVPETGNYGEDADFSASVATTGDITVKYGNLGINELADIADNGKQDGSAAGSTAPSNG